MYYNKLDIYQKSISEAIRSIRRRHQWTQGQLCKVLGISQPQLSAIEHKRCSLTAEQFLVFLQTFNLSLSDVLLLKSEDPSIPLRHSLQRLGAHHLGWDPAIPVANQLEDVYDVVLETLVTVPTSDHVCALAPVIVRHVRDMNIDAIGMRLFDLGLDGRIWWVVEGTLWAVRSRMRWFLPREFSKLYKKAVEKLERKSKTSNQFFSMRRGYPVDILEWEGRSSRAIEELKRKRDSLAERWRIVTPIRVEDFTQSLMEAEKGPKIISADAALVGTTIAKEPN